jgi:hypothetical protein
MNHSVKKIVCLLGATQLVGCSCFVPWNQDLVVSGTPSNAKVTIAGEGSRHSGGVFSLRRNKSYHGSISKEGYEEEYFYIASEINGFGALDIIGGCCFLVPFIGLAFPGSHSLSRDHYIYDLKPLADKK